MVRFPSVRQETLKILQVSHPRAFAYFFFRREGMRKAYLTPALDNITTPAKINFNQGLDGRKNFGRTAGRSSIEVREGVEVLARLFELF